ncbi:MAG TPA: CBS domain-containing protein [Kofleriaceae bacterium]|nr:CBS domain-containing protein [Kofleriaceae bacterium]
MPALPSLDREPDRVAPAERPVSLATGTWVEGLTGEGLGDRRQSPADAPITTLMVRDVACLSPRATAAEAAELLLEVGISGAPVVDAHGRPRGLVTRGDLLRELARGGGATRVEDLMTCMAFAVPVHASIGRAAALMAYEGVHRVLVVDESGRMCGIVSAVDVARWVAERSGHLAPSKRPGWDG